MIKILSYIYGTLINDENITNSVGEDIFPIIVPDSDGEKNVKFPHIVMNRISLAPNYTKGVECSQDIAEVEVVCWDISYFDVIELVENVRKSLEFKEGTVNDVKVNKCRVVSVDEGFSEVAYYQRIIFNFK